MRNKRTNVDFSKHELLTTSTDDLTVHYLKKPNTVSDSVKFINTNGICAVTGDYSNWIFCREFHPDTDGASDMYWKEKLKISSCQEPAKYDAERTSEEIQRRLNDPDEELSAEDKEYLERLLKYTDDELEYTYQAFREAMPSNWDYESIPFVKSINYHFLVILDAFDEICNRLNENVKP